jgi:hypothetical protein
LTLSVVPIGFIFSTTDFYPSAWLCCHSNHQQETALHPKYLPSGWIFAICALGISSAWAQAPSAYPAKPIRLIVPFAAGGPLMLSLARWGKYWARNLGNH